MSRNKIRVRVLNNVRQEKLPSKSEYGTVRMLYCGVYTVNSWRQSSCNERRAPGWFMLFFLSGRRAAFLRGTARGTTARNWTVPEMHLAGRKAIYARVQLIRLTANLVAEQSEDKRDLSCWGVENRCWRHPSEMNQDLSEWRTSFILHSSLRHRRVNSCCLMTYVQRLTSQAAFTTGHTT